MGRWMVVSLNSDGTCYAYGPFDTTELAGDWAERNIIGTYYLAQYIRT